MALHYHLLRFAKNQIKSQFQILQILQKGEEKELPVKQYGENVEPPEESTDCRSRNQSS
jgi:hypothetical protein